MTLLSVQDMKTDIGQYAALRSVMGHWQPSHASVTFQGQVITGLDTADITRKGIADVPGNTGIFGGLTVEENLILAPAKWYV